MGECGPNPCFDSGPRSGGHHLCWPSAKSNGLTDSQNVAMDMGVFVCVLFLRVVRRTRTAFYGAMTIPMLFHTCLSSVPHWWPDWTDGLRWVHTITSQQFFPSHHHVG